MITKNDCRWLVVTAAIAGFSLGCIVGQIVEHLR